MDENSYHAARSEINRLPCVFEKALLTRCAVCELSVRHMLAERETVACSSPLARAACGTLANLLREKSAFALKLKETLRILPHGMAMKIHCGGLNGLRDLLDVGAVAPDVHKLVRRAQSEYGSLEALPFSRIVQGIAAWQARKRFQPKDGA